MKTAADKRQVDMGKLAFVALGSNLGDSRQTIRNAMARLQDLSEKPILKSSLWRTGPVDCPPGSPIFVNAVAGLLPRKGQTAESLLKELQQVETEFGRARGFVINEPRTLDLDLIAFGAETRMSAQLILPHPRASVRRFVLQPLSEIAPDLVLPQQKKSVAKLLAALPTGEVVTRLD
jgi:2-amino-4-hydroxy-6-hydroxymethyldihydropteridine diphosphokinase